jgi:regulator of RNase E activity RraA
MTDSNAFSALSPTTLADAMGRDQVMDIGIRPLWQPMPRIAGPACTVRCAPGDNLMLHAAIYRTAPGSVIVVEAGDVDYAVAGFVVDGVIRDLAEVREDRFPVFARGVIPIPGGKRELGVLNGTVRCGGVQVAPGDVVVADEEGIVVVPAAQQDTVLETAGARAAKDAAESLEEWEAEHQARIDAILRDKGFVE